MKVGNSRVVVICLFLGFLSLSLSFSFFSFCLSSFLFFLSFFLSFFLFFTFPILFQLQYFFSPPPSIAFYLSCSRPTMSSRFKVALSYDYHFTTLCVIPLNLAVLLISFSESSSILLSYLILSPTV